MTLGRREFLQQLGVTLALLGGGDCVLAGTCDRYQQALANGSRCWALLVGINTYLTTTWQAGTPADKAAPLQGAVTDVALQRELLMGRFGVPAKNIMALLNEQATTHAIWAALQTHLIQQARPGDTVLFHFSGLGSQVSLPSLPTGAPLPTLVAADSFLPQAESPLSQDIFIENLAQLLGSLRGVKILTVLDVSSVPQPSQMIGNFRVRSRPSAPVGTWQSPLDAPLLLRQPTQSQSQLTRNWPGILLRGDTAEFPALEGTWNGYSTGLLTYALTQHLWQQVPNLPPPSWTALVEHTLATWTGVDPHLTDRAQTGDAALSGIPTPAAWVFPAVGCVQVWDVTNKQVTLWLGGLSPEVFSYSGVGLRLAPLSAGVSSPSVPSQPAAPSRVEPPASGSTLALTVKSLEGLTAKAEVSGNGPLSVGMPLREVERRLPKDIPLIVALDPTLERIERVDATSALAGLSVVTSVPPGEQVVDCVLGRVKGSDRPQPVSSSRSEVGIGGTAIAEAPESTLSRYGLFTPGHQLLPGTMAPAGEAVKKAVGRLTPPLRTLLAIKLCRLTLNSTASELPVALRVSGLSPSSAPISQVQTPLFGSARGERAPLRSPAEVSPPTAPFPYRIHLQAGEQPFYYLLLGVSGGIRLLVYCPKVALPNAAEAGEDDPVPTFQPAAFQLLAQQSLTFPGLREGNRGAQPIEIFAIAALQPFEQVWKAIRTPEFGQPSDRWAVLTDPLPIAKALLRDLHQAGQSPSVSNPNESAFVLRSQAWATLSLRVSPPPTPES